VRSGWFAYVFWNSKRCFWWGMTKPGEKNTKRTPPPPGERVPPNRPQTSVLPLTRTTKVSEAVCQWGEFGRLCKTSTPKKWGREGCPQAEFSSVAGVVHTVVPKPLALASQATGAGGITKTKDPSSQAGPLFGGEQPTMLTYYESNVHV